MKAQQVKAQDEASEPAMESIVNPQDEASEPASPVRTNHHEPPKEPPGLRPRWIEILESDPRWRTPRNGYIEDIEASYGMLDLTMEAQACVHWLQTKGKQRKTIVNTWNTWLKNSARDKEFPPTNYHGSRAKPLSLHERRMADEKALPPLRKAEMR